MNQLFASGLQDQNKLKNSSRDWNTRPPYLSPVKSVCRSRSNRTKHGTTDWFQIGKGILQGFILPSWLFNFYAEYIMWNARLDESQVGIKIADRNTNNLRYAADTTLTAESEDILRNVVIILYFQCHPNSMNIADQKMSISLIKSYSVRKDLFAILS